jgi:hypothetical protein
LLLARALPGGFTQWLCFFWILVIVGYMVICPCCESRTIANGVYLMLAVVIFFY